MFCLYLVGAGAAYDKKSLNTCTKDLSASISPSPYAMFIYASARSGEYETCTPTLTYARAKMAKESDGKRCLHGTAREYCHYCGSGDQGAEQTLLSLEDNEQMKTLQLKQVIANAMQSKCRVKWHRVQYSRLPDI